MKNYTTVKPAVKPDASFAPRGMKTYSEGRIELRNLQILNKMLEKSSQYFFPSAQPCEPKDLEVALKIAAVEKVHSENLWSRSTWKPVDSRFE